MSKKNLFTLYVALAVVTWAEAELPGTDDKPRDSWTRAVNEKRSSEYNVNSENENKTQRERRSVVKVKEVIVNGQKKLVLSKIMHVSGTYSQAEVMFYNHNPHNVKPLKRSGKIIGFRGDLLENHKIFLFKKQGDEPPRVDQLFNAPLTPILIRINFQSLYD